jgi:hypothetical protein
MAVIGGNTKSFRGRALEVGGWLPALCALAAIAGASFADAHHWIALPDWTKGFLDAYRGLRDQLLHNPLRKVVPTNQYDLAILGVVLATLALRKVVSFTFSIMGFVALAVLAWFAFTKLF